MHDTIDRLTDGSRPSESFVYVGSRTSRHREGKGVGIEVFRVSGDLEDWSRVQSFSLSNPSWLVASPTGSVIYAVHGDGNTVRVLRRDRRTGLLGFIDEVDSGGTNPVHAALTPDGRFLVVANHNSGTVAVLPLRGDETLGDPVSVLELVGELGPHRRDQNGAKPHQVVFDPSGAFLLVPDKGMDSVFILEIDDDGTLTMDPGRTVRLREMSGPRHIIFSPNGRHAWSVEEFRSTVTPYDWDPERGRLAVRQVLSALPETMTGDSRGAEIACHPDGRHVYVSNRGGPGDASPGGFYPDTIATFDVEDGLLLRARWVTTAGIRPRFFKIDPSGRALVVAHERGHSIGVHPLTPSTGSPGDPVTAATTGSPVALLFIPVGTARQLI